MDDDAAQALAYQLELENQQYLEEIGNGTQRKATNDGRETTQSAFLRHGGRGENNGEHTVSKTVFN